MHDRMNASAAATQQPAAETIANLALVLNVTAIVAFAISVSESGYGRAGLAATVGVVAVLCFAASLACFASDTEATPVPQTGAERRRVLPRITDSVSSRLQRGLSHQPLRFLRVTEHTNPFEQEDSS